MKRIIMLAALLLMSAVPSFSQEVGKSEVEYNYDAPVMNWASMGTQKKKIQNIGYKILRENDIRLRMVFTVDGPQELSMLYKLVDYGKQMSPVPIPVIKFDSKVYGYWPYKTIHFNTGLFSHIDNDDELAFLVAHEIAHMKDFYHWYNPSRYLSMVRPFAMRYIYEKRADKKAIDYMVKAGYNPMGAITYVNKTQGEYADWFSVHPNGSKRLKKIYRKIEKDYPSYLSGEYEDNIYFINYDKYYHRKRDRKLEKQRQKEL